MLVRPQKSVNSNDTTVDPFVVLYRLCKGDCGLPLPHADIHNNDLSLAERLRNEPRERRMISVPALCFGTCPCRSKPRPNIAVIKLKKNLLLGRQYPPAFLHAGRSDPRR